MQTVESARSPFLTVEPRRGWLELGAGELWRYRELWWTLAGRDIRVRYKQTVLGAAWAVIQPLTAMIVFTLVFAKMAKLPTDGVPAPVFYYAGLLAWTFFSQTVSGASQSLIEGSRLVTKVYFPRILIPLSVTGYTLLNLCVATLLLLVLMPLYGVQPTARMLLLPAVILGVALAAIGMGTLIGALTVKYRDFRHIVPFLIQLWLFASPVMYPASLIPERWRLVAALNPMVGLVDAARACIVGTTPDLRAVAVSAVVAVGLFVVGFGWFRRVEDDFADII